MFIIVYWLYWVRNGVWHNFHEKILNIDEVMILTRLAQYWPFWPYFETGRDHFGFRIRKIGVPEHRSQLFPISRHFWVRGLFRRSQSHLHPPLRVSHTAHRTPHTRRNSTDHDRFKLQPPPLLSQSLQLQLQLQLIAFIITATNHDSINRQNERFLRLRFRSFELRRREGTMRAAVTTTNRGRPARRLMTIELQTLRRPDIDWIAGWNIFLILELARSGADTKIRVSIQKMFFGNPPYFNPTSDWKKCSFYTLPLNWGRMFSGSTHAIDKVEHPMQ